MLSSKNPSPPLRRSLPARLAAGFTLVELLVVIIILAVVMAIGFPSFTAVFNNNRLSSTANEVVASVQIARIEAVRRNTRVILCNSADGATCTNVAAGVAWTGWIVLVPDGNGDGTANDPLLLRRGEPPPRVQLRASDALATGQLVFRSDGYARNGTAGNAPLANGSVAVCIVTTRPAQNERMVAVAAGSRISTRVLNGAGACDKPTDA
ncbi:GspH/FimT family pseudopilin [Montanilutibacter psychrotolerans]|uniref:Type II secretion system protein H n=1 Tax=Montanilutibacter psychrotolerans TaxID=1327343 RepID=A0A3M8SXX4_9GAMM|nr:GspH/FimT family pseudopilin [Lysobacter psychrotolerans]RNF86167.1 prepilin-type N-terminal cleavage/methylation domain-containing protein [Lysobacter psychrotolerans]